MNKNKSKNIKIGRAFQVIRDLFREVATNNLASDNPLVQVDIINDDSVVQSYKIEDIAYSQDDQAIVIYCKDKL